MINADRRPTPMTFTPRVAVGLAAEGSHSSTRPCETCDTESPASGIGQAPATEYTKAKRRKGDSDTEVHTTAPVALPKANADEAESPAPGIGPATAISHQPLPSERRKPMEVSAKRERAERDARLAAIRAAATARQRRFMGI